MVEDKIIMVSINLQILTRIPNNYMIYFLIGRAFQYQEYLQPWHSCTEVVLSYWGYLTLLLLWWPEADSFWQFNSYCSGAKNDFWHFHRERKIKNESQVCTHVHKHMHVNTHMHMLWLSLTTCFINFTSVHAYLYTYTYTYICMYTHAYRQTYIHINIVHTYKQAGIYAFGEWSRVPNAT